MRSRTPPRAGSSYAASRNEPRTAAAPPSAGSPWPRTSPISTRTPYAVGTASYRSPPTAAPRLADSWAAQSARPSIRPGSGRSSTRWVAPAISRERRSSAMRPRRVCRAQPVARIRKAAQLARLGASGPGVDSSQDTAAPPQARTHARRARCVSRRVIIRRTLPSGSSAGTIVSTS
ncbi:hypothetical protein ACFWJT_16090 [Streptomyces sp. NPDC127069]|uniref:hypothetical protein n=1 Tax=Streptomyces sp. NPDC127069 TaxID=3347128 RepID=UPI003665FC45